METKALTENIMQIVWPGIHALLSASFMKKSEHRARDVPARDEGSEAQRISVAAGDAMRWRARGDGGTLRVAQGSVWITFDWPPRGRRHRSGDHFIDAGGSIALCAGESIVLEPLGGVRGQPAALIEWRPAVRCAANEAPTAGLRAPAPVRVHAPRPSCACATALP